MKSIFTLSLVLAITAGANALAATDHASNLKPFSYRVVEVAHEGATCAQHAQKLADLFTRLTGFQVTGTSCNGRTLTEKDASFRLDTVIVNYEGENLVQPFQAIFGGQSLMNVPSPQYALFSTLAECEDEITDQSNLFEIATGLPAFSAECKGTTNSVSPGYSLVISSFGKAKRALFVADLTNYASDYTAPELTVAAMNVVSATGATVAFHDATHILYYAQYATPVLVSQLANFEVTEQCTSQLAEAKAAYAVSGLESVQVFCLPAGDKDPVHGHLTVVGGGMSMIQSDGAYNSPVYSSFDDCMADRPRMVQNAVSSGHKVTGSLCRPGNGLTDFVVEMYFGRF